MRVCIPASAKRIAHFSVLRGRRHQHHGIRPGFDEVVEGSGRVDILQGPCVRRLPGLRHR